MEGSGRPLAGVDSPALFPPRSFARDCGGDAVRAGSECRPIALRQTGYSPPRGQMIRLVSYSTTHTRLGCGCEGNRVPKGPERRFQLLGHYGSATGIPRRSVVQGEARKFLLSFSPQEFPPQRLRRQGAGISRDLLNLSVTGSAPVSGDGMKRTGGFSVDTEFTPTDRLRTAQGRDASSRQHCHDSRWDEWLQAVQGRARDRSVR